MLEASFNTRGTEGPVAVFLSYWSLFILWYIIQCLYALHFYDYTITDFFSLSVRRVRCYFCTDLKVSSNLKLSLKMHDCKTGKMNKAASAAVAPLAASDLQCVSKKSCQWCHLLSAQSQFSCPVLRPPGVIGQTLWISSRLKGQWLPGDLLAVGLCEQLGIRSHFYSCW